MAKDNTETVLLRDAGLVSLLYWFMHAYYGVGSVKNALGAAMPQGQRAIAISYGLAWAAYFIFGLACLLKTRWGMTGLKAASFASFVTLSFGTLFFTHFSELPMFLSAVLICRPAAELFFFLMLQVYSGRSKMEAGPESGATLGYGGRPFIRRVLLLGALLPWISALTLRMIFGVGSGPIIPFSFMGLFSAAFMTLWFDIPFTVLLIIAGVFPRLGGRLMSAGGAGGVMAAGLIVFFAIWREGFEPFLMAITPPMIFSAMGLGVLAGGLWGRRVR